MDKCFSTSSLTCEGVIYSRRSGFHLGPITHTFTVGLTSIVGANGAGKSTFFNMISGDLRPKAGTLVLLDAESVGYLPQSPDLPGHATVADFMEYVAWLYGVRRKQRSGFVDQALSVTDLSERAKSPIRSLSGGMKRRLGIAQAIVHQPSVVLLDEPTVGLDPLQRVRTRELIRRIADDHIVLMATHLIEDVLDLSDQILVFQEGSVRFSGTAEELEKYAARGGIGTTELERGLTYLMGESDDSLRS